MEQEEQVNKIEEVDNLIQPKEAASKPKKGFSFKLFAKLVIISVLVFSFVQYSKGNKLTSPEVKALDNAQIEQIIKSMIPATSKISIKSIAEENNLYVINLLAENGQEFAGYLTKDGKTFFPQAIKVEEAQKQKEEAEKAAAVETKEIAKNDKPIVELFVMSHCPYGTQIEKGFLPVINALGDKIDFKVKFVDYSMHGEKEVKEQLNQYCIQKEEPAKFIGYLKCFLDAGNGSDCVTKSGINVSKMNSCVKSTDGEFKVIEKLNDKSTWVSGQFAPFDIFKSENEAYGVQGSPTLIINGAKSESPRDPKSLLSAVCSGFTTQPEACKTELPAEPAAAGFGFNKAGNATEASCGS